MVAGVIHISDEFELGADKDNDSDGGDAPFFTKGMKNNIGDVILPVKGGVEYEPGEGESCMNTLAAALGAALFLMIQGLHSIHFGKVMKIITKLITKVRFQRNFCT